MKVLGLVMNDIGSSACLIHDGRIAAAVQEERLIREKQTRRFPVQAVRWCLRSAGMGLRDLDAVATSINPAIYLEALNPAQSERLRFRGESLYAIPNYLLNLDRALSGGQTTLEMDREGGKPLVLRYIRHHDAHAAGAYFSSPFDSAAVFTADAFGEKDSTVWFRARGSKLERLRSVEFPDSIGSFYSAMTDFLGFRPLHEEWKLMGAAAYGDPSRFQDKLGRLIRVTEEGGLETDLSYFNYYLFHRPGWTHPKLETLIGPSYRDGDEWDERFYDLAAAVQAVAESVTLELLARFAKETGEKNLCFSGGVAMNCLMNGKIHERTEFENVYVPFSPDDSGAGLGAALATAHSDDPGTPRESPLHSAYGPEYGEGEIEETLRLAKVPFQRLDDAARTAADRLIQGRIVGWFQGRMEFGDRALGFRSILADPRDPGMKDRINALVKFREPFRPFAPAVLLEKQPEWFDCGAPVWYMEKAFRIRAEKRDLIPSVVHEDGTGRLQSVTDESNAPLRRLIECFFEATGVPIVLNTSFNLQGEPIVMTPRDALRTFYSCGMDDLFLGPFHVSKG